MRNETILIVDDEVNICRSIARTLMDENYFILTANSGEEGLERFLTHNIDLVISDQNMPGMSGLEFLRRVEEGHPGTLTIMLTAHADAETLMKAINETSLCKFIVKPWAEDEIRTTMRLVLDARKELIERNRPKKAIKGLEDSLAELERKHPGITSVRRDRNGRVLL